MPVLQAMDGKFYDIPDDQASQFEVPREKVKELLEKAGAPAPQGGGGPGPGQGQGQMQPQGPGGAPGPSGGAPPPSVLVQIYGAQPMQSYGPPPGQQQPPPQQQGEPGQGGGSADGDVNPYWWWRNITFYRPWGNFWPNWGNW